MRIFDATQQFVSNGTRSVMALSITRMAIMDLICLKQTIARVMNIVVEAKTFLIILTNIILHHSFYSSATLVGDFHLFSSENFSCIDEQSIPIDYWMISCSSGHDLFSFHRNPLFSILPKQQELRQYQLEMFVYGGICSISLSNYSSRR
jgi:hypothetical protein